MLQIKAFNNPLVEWRSTLAASDILIAPRQPFIFYGCFLLFSLTGRLKPLSCCLSVNDRETPWTGHLSLQGGHNNKHIMIHTVGSSDPVSTRHQNVNIYLLETAFFTYYCHLDVIKSLKAAACWNTEGWKRTEKSEIRTRSSWQTIMILKKSPSALRGAECLQGAEIYQWITSILKILP